jgi:hypothetical protein
MDLPQTCFISHAYSDPVDKLIKTLPKDVKARTFPQIVVPPAELVSNALVTCILSCDGLIYLNGGRSARSFWVAFERDYALRAGKAVFSASMDDYALSWHKEKALDLAIFSSYHREDRPRVVQICDFLRSERHFDIWIDNDRIAAGDGFAAKIEGGIQGCLERGGYVVVFWSSTARNSHFVEREIESAVKGMGGANDRVLFALLDETPLPEFWQGQEAGVQLFGDRDRTENQRLDDLVVRLYWLIYRKTDYANIGEEDA